MTSFSERTARLPSRRKWLRVALLILIFEKVVQHLVVSLAFMLDWAAIRSTVAVSPNMLMFLGVVAVLGYGLVFWGVVTNAGWFIPLLIGLALLDIVGEFVAQGRVGIVVTVSFIVAALILALALVWIHEGRGEREHA